MKILIILLLAFSILFVEKIFAQDDIILQTYRALEISNKGDYKLSCKIFKQILEKQEKLYGLNNLDGASCLLNYGVELKRIGDYESALHYLRKSYDIRKKLCGEESIEAAQVLNEIAVIYSIQGNYKFSIDLQEKTLSIYLNSLGYNDIKTIVSINNLASLNYKIGNYKKSLELYHDAFKAAEKNFGSDHIQVSLPLNNLGACYRDLGDFEMALQLIEKAYKIRKTKLGDHPDTAQSLGELSYIYLNLGQYSKSLSMFNEALRMKSAYLPQDHIEIAELLNAIGIVYCQSGNYDEALKYHLDALSKVEAKFNQNHPFISSFNNNIGICLHALEKYDQALAYINKSLSSAIQVFGDDHTEVGKIMTTLGVTYEKQEKYDQAINYYKKAADIFQKKYGVYHFTSTLCYHYIISASAKSSNHNTAKEYSLKAVAGKSYQLDKVLLLSEQERLSWKKKEISNWYANFLDPKDIANYSLKFKGIILESVSEDRATALAAGSTSGGDKILLHLKTLQDKFSKIAFEQGREEDVSKLQDEIGRLQREFTSKYLGRDRKRASASITMSEVTPALSAGGVLVDFFQFNDPKLKNEDATCLGAIITGEDNNPVFVRIDNGAAVNRAVKVQ